MAECLREERRMLAAGGEREDGRSMERNEVRDVAVERELPGASVAGWRYYSWGETQLTPDLVVGK